MFNLAPDYPLALLCLVIIGIQLGLLRMQAIYGPKKVVPAFMLEPVFDYKFEEELNT